MGNPARKHPASRKAVPGPGNLVAHTQVTSCSGIYHVEYEDGRPPKELFIRKGTTLPPLDPQGKAIRFSLLRKLSHISEDPDFC